MAHFKIRYKNVIRFRPARLWVLLLFCGFCLGARGQNTGKHAVFLELGGSGGLGSVNYEHRFWEKGKAALTWRAGLSFAPIDKNNGTGIVFPLMLNTLLGKTAHQLELGLGQGITITTKGRFFALTTAAIGYRFRTRSERWFFRLAYTPLISYLLDFQFQHWAGLSIGYNFNSK